jgi:HEAT repeat protein
MMEYVFLWTPEALDKIAQHGVTVEEYESVVNNPVDRQLSRSSDNLIARGDAITGRWLICVYQDIDEITVLPITGYVPDDHV